MKEESLDDLLKRKDELFPTIKDIFLNCVIAQKLRETYGELPKSKVIDGKEQMGCILFLTQEEYLEHSSILFEYSHLTSKIAKLKAKEEK